MLPADVASARTVVGCPRLVCGCHVYGAVVVAPPRPMGAPLVLSIFFSRLSVLCLVVRSTLFYTRIPTLSSSTRRVCMWCVSLPFL